MRLTADSTPSSRLEALVDELRVRLQDGSDPVASTDLVRSRPDDFPRPGTGSTRTLWESLASVAAVDLTAARTLEPHLDALAILAEARSVGHPVPSGVPDGASWGVFAAEGPGVRLEARDDSARAAGAVRLHGTKPWCSLAGSLSHALVTAWDSDTTRRLYAVRLGSSNGVTVQPSAWFARGLTAVPSGPVDFDGAEAVPVGPTGWYLERPGFAWGGMGVAAVWYGGAVGVARRLLRRGREPDQIAQMHVGAVDADLWAARACLDDAAARVDDGRATGEDGGLLALRVRHVVARAAESVVERVGHATGPAPLALDDDHAARVADLQLYLRQEHAERDEAALGRQVLERHVLDGGNGTERPPW
ncbi:acyl-CoA dehydrogenase family protein [Terracoccus sp. 273MFTsu3.1]|uniref:acyl-CoA dehydrogenase family protein n=1 Tax=Terracoccus sp. 273MFTsu3.1 TaxID=1172188 RepID=UPI0003663839|nr:acyl-CoA dehydrogenase family protein [Terracoccus sp. 273MFTsu3.1]